MKKSEKILKQNEWMESEELSSEKEFHDLPIETEARTDTYIEGLAQWVHSYGITISSLSILFGVLFEFGKIMKFTDIYYATMLGYSPKIEMFPALMSAFSIVLPALSWTQIITNALIFSPFIGGVFFFIAFGGIPTKRISEALRKLWAYKMAWVIAMGLFIGCFMLLTIGLRWDNVGLPVCVKDIDQKGGIVCSDERVLYVIAYMNDRSTVLFKQEPDETELKVRQVIMVPTSNVTNVFYAVEKGNPHFQYPKKVEKVQEKDELNTPTKEPRY